MTNTDFPGRSPISEPWPLFNFVDDMTGFDKAAATVTLVEKIAKLPPEVALVLQLIYVEGLNIMEVSAALDIHPLDVCIAKHRALGV